MKLGYCCINQTLSESKIRINRGMIKKTFDLKGISYCSELIEKNLDDLLRILKWNVSNNIFLYRMSSSMFPMWSFYNLENLPNFDKITEKLQIIGNYIKENGIRAGFHPDHFCVLASLKPEVVFQSAHELNNHGQIMDIMGLNKSPYYYINVHLNTTQPNKQEAITRFIKNAKLLSDSTLSRLTIEIDDNYNGFNVFDLMRVYAELGTPIVFDNLHHSLNTGSVCFEMAVNTCLNTWKGVMPLIHWSSSKRKHEDSTARECAHADYIYDKIPPLCCDVEIEAKAKEKALIDYLKKFT